ncbi:hypothetical protein MTO96_008560 [Rhipicephalus appendiculatus]
MKNVAIVVAFALLCVFRVRTDDDTDCNATLPWSASQVDHPAVLQERLDELLRCPDGLHGCSAVAGELTKDFFLWPCDSTLVDIQTCPEGTDLEMKRRCSTYFAPVELAESEFEIVYKNVYCGLCHGIHPSSLNFDLPETFCLGVAVALHYGFLCTFFWTSVLSFDIWKNVVAVRRSSIRHGGILLYCFVAWGFPTCYRRPVRIDALGNPRLLAVAAVRTLRLLDWQSSGVSSCFFLTPMMALLLYDIGLYIHIVVHIRRTVKRAASFDFKGGGKKHNMALFVKLAFIMGTTWLVGFVGAFLNIYALDILVIILIGLQGVYLFFGFKDYRYMCPKRRHKEEKTVATSASTGGHGTS